MFTHVPRIGLGVLAGLVAFGAVLPSVQAQFQIAPTSGAQAPYSMGATSSSSGFSGPFSPGAGSAGSMYSTSPSTSPRTPAAATTIPNPFPPYPPPYQPYSYSYADPFGGNLYGSAAVIDSAGKLMTSTQQAYLMQEQVKREKIENRRRVFDQWLYERNNTPSVQDEFERMQKLELRRSQNDPPVNEILSAKALNDLLIDIQKLQGKDYKATDLKLDDEILKNINVSPPGKGSANIGLLKKDGPLSWPVTLRGLDYKKDRDLINTLITEAVRQASSGPVDVATLKDMNYAVDRLQQQLALRIKEMPPNQYIESKRFLNDFKDALNALGLEDASHYFNGKYKAKGKTVAELIDNMTKLGLRFAPAVAGDESAYVALHRLLATFDVTANSSLSPGEQR